MSIASTHPATGKSSVIEKLPLTARIAARELRSGIGGFVVFIACVALGVMVISAVGTLSDSLKTGLESQGRSILGGDISLGRMHTRANAEERAAMQAAGRMAEAATMRTMARAPDGSENTLGEIKGVDGSYPLVGELLLKDGKSLDDAIGTSGTAAVDPILLERLGLEVGDQIKVGSTLLTISAAIEKEPDGLTDRLTFGPRILTSLETMESTGLITPGALVRWRYAIALPETPLGNEALVAALSGLGAKLESAGFTVADRRDPSPQVKRVLERLRQFLTLIGLTSLLVGGVGVANAVATFIDRRRKTIATLKSIGASNAQVFAIFLWQILAMSLVGIAIGLAAGVLVPAVLQMTLGGLLPIPSELSVSASSLLVAGLYGLLVALLFTLWPLGLAERVTAAVLFRDEVAGGSGIPHWTYIAATLVVGLSLAALAILSSDAQKIAAYFIVAVAIVFAVFIALGFFVTWAARRVPRPRRPELALAVRNLGAPGGLTRAVVLSLGSGLSLLMAVALVDASLVKELSGRIPDNSPDYFVLDIPKQDMAKFLAVTEDKAPGTIVKEAPMLRGRLVSLKGVPVEQIKPPSEAEWVLNGDRGITYASDVPEGSKVVEGEWWPADYSGENLVSFEADLGKLLGLKIGDTITVNVLGRNITAKIANFREVEWESLAINFVLVFTPPTLAGAPTNRLATVTLPKGSSLETQAGLSRALAQAFPTITEIRVRDAIESFNAIFAKIMLAVRVAGGVTLIAGALVLAGALATAQRRRILEAVILKALGATQARILTAHALEYGLLALVTAGFAVALGTAAAWSTLTFVMDVPFSFSLTALAQAMSVALGLVLVFGGLGTWQVLRARPVPYLRSE